MARPKSSIERKAIGTTLKVELLERLKVISEEEKEVVRNFKN